MGGQLFTFQPPDFNSPPRTLKHQHRCTLTLVAGRNGVCDDCMLRLGNSPHPVAYWCAACDYDLCLPCVKSGRKVITCNHHNRKLWNLLLKVAKSTLVRGLQMLRPVLATDYQPRCPHTVPVSQSSSTDITLHTPHNSVDVGRGIVDVEAKIPSRMQMWTSQQRSAWLALTRDVSKPQVAAAVLKCMSDALKPGTLARATSGPRVPWHSPSRAGVCRAPWSHYAASHCPPQHGPLGTRAAWAAYEAELWGFIPVELRGAFRNADSAHRQAEGLEALWGLLVELHTSLSGVPGVFRVRAALRSSRVTHPARCAAASHCTMHCAGGPPYI